MCMDHYAGVKRRESLASSWPGCDRMADAGGFLMQAQPARREFVKAAAAAIATAQFPILGANDRINIGIVGLGGRGTDHINFYSKLDSEARIAAVCDVNQSARERAVALVRKLRNYDPKEFPEMRALFESKDIDAVSIT